jgi:hypothetical protein
MAEACVYVFTRNPVDRILYIKQGIADRHPEIANQETFLLKVIKITDAWLRG